MNKIFNIFFKSKLKKLKSSEVIIEQSNIINWIINKFDQNYIIIIADEKTGELKEKFTFENFFK
jgi:hypothetical protein